MLSRIIPHTWEQIYDLFQTCSRRWFIYFFLKKGFSVRSGHLAKSLLGVIVRVVMNVIFSSIKHTSSRVESWLSLWQSWIFVTLPFTATWSHSSSSIIGTSIGTLCGVWSIFREGVGGACPCSLSSSVISMSSGAE